MKNISATPYPVSAICSMVGISRQGYYKRLSTQKRSANRYCDLEQIVIEERALKSRVGLRVIYHKNHLSSLLGINQFEQKMSLFGHALKARKSFYKTTNSSGHHHKYSNLLAGKSINGANQAISGDITYFQSGSDLFYIFLLTDIYTFEIKGILGGKNMEGVHAERCLRQVMKFNGERQYKNTLIVHTDAGGQYRSNAYQHLLRKAGMLPSQARSCYENGLAERINGIVKNDYLIDYTVKSLKHLNQILKKVQKDHNELWPSARLKYKTPSQYATWIRGLPERQRPIMKIKEINT